MGSFELKCMSFTAVSYYPDIVAGNKHQSQAAALERDGISLEWLSWLRLSQITGITLPLHNDGYRRGKVLVRRQS